MIKMQPKRKAFTLVEIIVVITILGILAGLGAPMLAKLFDSFQFILYRKSLTESADAALRRISREIRRAADDTSVFTANSTTYRFNDINGNTIQYQLSGSDLNREFNGASDTLLANVSSFSFTYLEDDAAAAIAAPLVNPQATDIKFIQADITLQEGGNTINYRLLIKLRNVTHISDLFA
jgi:prepilin-type N-terminal cleavage/methylation domain-containing protein